MAKRRKRTNANVPAKGRLKDFADRLWSLAVRDDWNYQCAVCGKGKTDAHHLIPRQHESTRYELRNGIALCSYHHQFDADISPHQSAAGWMRWLEFNLPMRHEWLTDQIASREYRTFGGTTNAAYYIEHILRLREYVDDETFETVCGKKFTRYLLNT
jgi:hypothetical protein